MAEQVEYYAVVPPGRQVDAVSGLARRRYVDNGIVDESLRRDLSWGPTSAIHSWHRAELTEKLVPVSEEEAEGIVERFRVTWGPPPGM
jgi:hypothetical protein